MGKRLDVEFDSDNITCRAWCYPGGGRRGPVIVLAHGLGGTRDMRLDAFAERFNAAGYACLLFDYRYFGVSDGTPRRLIDVGAQLADWAAAVTYVRTRPDVDPDRVVLWGTSFSGGHVMVTAARDGRIAAVVDQGPFTDGVASALATHPRSAVRVTVAGLADLAAAALGRGPVRVALAGPPGSKALMTAPDAEPGLRALLPGAATFDNDTPARIAVRLPLRRPGRSARRITCPMLVCVCSHDSVAPAGATMRHLRRAPRAQVLTYSDGHFAIYVGEPFERVVADQLAFLRAEVPLSL